ncbi:hypothetical protein JTB14_033786 [Gonioctena quinquepunctata]|nr:hypothetical protein JTB14_033786 [Gonioctena quinquepunctata]
MTRYLTDAELEDIINNLSESSDNKAPLQTEFQESDSNFSDIIIQSVESETESESEHDDDGDDQLSEDKKKCFYGKKNRYKWSKSPPASTRTKAENIILQLPWLNGPAANNLPTTPYGAWSLLVTDNILDIIVEHTNRKITDESHKYGGKSLITIKHKGGPKLDPCSTPDPAISLKCNELNPICLDMILKDSHMIGAWLEGCHDVLCRKSL